MPRESSYENFTLVLFVMKGSTFVLMERAYLMIASLEIVTIGLLKDRVIYATRFLFKMSFEIRSVPP